MQPTAHKEGNSAEPWGCSCGGTEDSCDGQIVQCGTCSVRHHEACAFDLLKGDCFVAKFALLRPTTFRCLICEPERYSWLFQCSCIKAGKAVVLDFDDGSDMVECVKCLRWSHDACAFTRTESTATEALSPVCYACTSEWGKEVEWFTYSSNAMSCGEIETGLVALSTPIDSPTNVSNSITGSKTKKISIPRLRGGLMLRSGGMRDEKIADEVVTRGCYERPIFDFEILPGDVWIDVGAHIGVFTSLALSAGAKVIAVEPELGNFEMLSQNAALNVDQSRGPSNPQSKSHHCYNLLQTAVLESVQLFESSTTLHLHPEIGFRHSVIEKPRRSQWATCTVPATTLSALLDSYPDVTSVKVDIRGAEVGVIRSVTNWYSVRKLVFEYDFEYSPSMEDFHSFILDLKQHFSYIHHSRLAKTGNFIGFPTGVVVFAKRDPPRDTSELPYIVTKESGKSLAGLVRAGRQRSVSAPALKKIKATYGFQNKSSTDGSSILRGQASNIEGKPIEKPVPMRRSTRSSKAFTHCDNKAWAHEGSNVPKYKRK